VGIVAAGQLATRKIQLQSEFIGSRIEGGVIGGNRNNCAGNHHVRSLLTNPAGRKHKPVELWETTEDPLVPRSPESGRIRPTGRFRLITYKNKAIN
jgi:hypothetical protein